MDVMCTTITRVYNSTWLYNTISTNVTLALLACYIEHAKSNLRYLWMETYVVSISICKNEMRCISIADAIADK